MPQARHYNSAAERQAAYRRRVAQARETQLAAKGFPALPAPANVPGTHRWRRLLEQARFSLDAMEAEMQAYAEERSCSWRDSEKGELFEEKTQAVAQLSAAAHQLESDYF